MVGDVLPVAMFGPNIYLTLRLLPWSPSTGVRMRRWLLEIYLYVHLCIAQTLLQVMALIEEHCVIKPPTIRLNTAKRRIETTFNFAPGRGWRKRLAVQPVSSSELGFLGHIQGIGVHAAHMRHGNSSLDIESSVKWASTHSGDTWSSFLLSTLSLWLFCDAVGEWVCRAALVVEIVYSILWVRLCSNYVQQQIVNITFAPKIYVIVCNIEVDHDQQHTGHQKQMDYQEEIWNLQQQQRCLTQKANQQTP